MLANHRSRFGARGRLPKVHRPEIHAARIDPIDVLERVRRFTIEPRAQGVARPRRSAWLAFAADPIAHVEVLCRVARGERRPAVD
ncbi:MAG TPA: hypothetical protein VH054_21715, partial [Polyangiaceae bacterium]|nr:hypothetical protein [Polyangiaceae bacterium]